MTHAKCTGNKNRQIQGNRRHQCFPWRATEYMYVPLASFISAWPITGKHDNNHQTYCTLTTEC